MAGKRTTKPSRTLRSRNTAKWIVGLMLFLVVGGCEYSSPSKAPETSSGLARDIG